MIAVAVALGSRPYLASTLRTGLARGSGRPPRVGEHAPSNIHHAATAWRQCGPASGLREPHASGRHRVVREPLYALVVLWDDDAPLEELAAGSDAEELCRQLLASPWGFGSSTRYREAVDLLANVQGAGDLPASFVALLLCTCRRWDRVTARLIAGIEESGLLSDDQLDDLTESLLADELVISYPLAWVSPQWLDVDLRDGAGLVCTVDEDALGEHRPSLEPPLRRWAARRALRADPEQLDDLLSAASRLEPRHRDALIHGLLDAADALDENRQRSLVRRGLKTAQAGVRRAALDRLCELDGPETARRRARADANAAVRRWHPPHPELRQAQGSLLGA